ncbi:MAG: BrnT family toxin [Thermodesulfobacteriota bacterium]
MLRIDDFIWLPDIIEKIIVKHHVTPDEAEGIFFSRPTYRFVESGYTKGEDIYSAMGQTDSGRYLIVFFILKPHNAALILTARDMDRKERRLYERR